MHGRASRETAERLQRAGEVKVKLQSDTCVLKGVLLDGNRHMISARVIDENGEYASHMPKANAQMQALVETIQWGRPHEVLTNWNSETPS